MHFREGENKKVRNMKTYTVGFTGHMEGTTLERGEVLKEYCNEDSNVLSRFFGSALSHVRERK
jgi:hypothetical protein